MSAVLQVMGSSIGGDIRIGDIVYTRSDLEELRDYLAHAVAAYEKDKLQTVLKRSILPHPYKFLDPFGLKDEPIFFGRETATEELSKKVLRDRLTVLHAKSGAGKTSLLNAGLSPCLIREGHLPLYVHAYYKGEDPVLTIKRTITSAEYGPWPRLLHDLPLHVFLGLICACLSNTQELIVMLDQFEQFFILWPQLEARSPFIRALGACYDDQKLRLHFIIALRKDYYSDLDEFNQVLPHLNIFQNQYRLRDMTQAEAQKAIIGPLARLGISVMYEPALLETLLADLKRGQMELPLLQIICTRLYETRSKDEAQITLKMYEALGRGKGVLSNYLRGTLAELPGRQEALARNVLKELVRSDGMKQVPISYKALAVRVEAQGDELARVLDRLGNVRLLSREEMRGEILYELAHEYLAMEIFKWVNSADQEIKQAEELLERELANWRVQYMLIPKSRLEVLYRYRERFKGLDAQAWECLISSALKEDFAVVDWVKTAGESGERALFQVLKASDVWIRARCVLMLEELRTPRAVEPLIAALRDKDSRVRSEAAKALGQLGDPRAVEPLITTLREDEDSWVRGQAVEALQALGDPRAIEPLIATLRKDEDSKVRAEAAMALKALGDPRAIEPLIATLRDKDSGVRYGTTVALGQLGDPRAIEPLIATLRKDEDSKVWEGAAEALKALGDPRAVEPLIATLMDESSKGRYWAAGALEGLGDPRAVEPLIAALMDKDVWMQLWAAWALGGLGDPRAVEPLIAALRKDEDSLVRRQAAWALGQLGDSRAVEPLIATLRKDKGSAVRREAAGALGQLGDPRAVKPLITTLREDDEDSGVREQAVEALQALGDPRAIKPLIAVLMNVYDHPVHKQAAEALKALGDPRTVELLITALRKDEDSLVRRQAAWALGQLGNPHAVEPLTAAWRKDEDGMVRAEAAVALKVLGDLRAVEPLITALKDKNSGVRHWAAEVLGRLGDPRAVEPLIATLREDEDSGVRRQAVEALQALGDRRAIKPLIATWRKDKESAVQNQAAGVLMQLGVDPFTVVLEDEDEGEDPIPVR